MIATSDAELRQRAWDAAASVVDPEIPVLTIADLGVLREVTVRDDGCVDVAITPTYSGCPAMSTIAFDVAVALERAGFHVSHGAVAGLDHRLDERGRPPQASGLRHRAAAAGKLAPRAVRRAAGGLSAMRLRGYRAAVGIRFDLLQGVMALQALPRTVRLFQVSLIMSRHLVIASQRVGAKRRPTTGSAKQSRVEHSILDCFVALLLAMTAES